MSVADKAEIKKMRNRAWDANFRGEHHDAIELYNKVLALDPASAYLTYAWRAVAYIDLKDYARAIDDCNKAIELNPKYSEAYLNRGWAYFESGNYEQAISDFSKAIERRKNNHIAYVNRAAAYIELEDYARAIDDCNKAIELQPKYAPAYYNLSECYKSLGETAKAQAAFVKAKQLGYRV